MKSINYIIPGIISSLLLASACVPKSEHEAIQKQLAECAARATALTQSLDELKKQSETEIAALKASRDDVEKRRQAEIAKQKAVTSRFVRRIEAQDNLSVRVVSIAETEITVVMAIKPIERQVDTTIGGTPMYRMQTVPFPRYLRAEFRSPSSSKEVVPAISPQVDNEGTGIYTIALPNNLSEACVLVLRREAR